MISVFRLVLIVALAAAQLVAIPVRPWLNPGISDPRNLANLAAWYDASDTSSMLAGNGTQITDGGAVALWGDKSGNSGVNCLVLPGVAGNYASAGDTADITGDIDIIVNLSVNNVAPSAFNVIAAKYNGTTNQRSYILFQRNTAGMIGFASSVNGTVAITSYSTVALSSVGITAYSKFWLRVTLDVDNGSGGNTVRFYYGSDGVTWTAFGDAVVNAGTTSIYSSTSPVEFGTQDAGSANPFAGNIYRAIIKDGIDGTTVLDIDFSTAAKKLANGDTFVCATGQTVTLNSSGATGARIAGERDLFQGTLANRPVYLQYAGTKYGYLNGTAGNYFSTPDSAAVSPTTAVDIIAGISLADWTPGTTTAVVSKWLTTGDQRSVRLNVTTTGTLLLSWSVLGTAASAGSAQSDAAVGVADGSFKYIRGTLAVGGANGVANFYTSDDRITWTQLGTANVPAIGCTAIYDSTTNLEVGGIGGTAELFTGRVYYASISKTIPATPLTDSGTPTAVFNPALYTSGTTFTASTGEVWTINGGAHIVTRTGLYGDGVNDFLKMAEANMPQPQTVYWTGGQTSWTLDDTLFDGTNAALVRQTTSTPEISINAGAFAAANTGLVVKTAALLRAVFNGASSALGINRLAATTGNAGTNIPNGFTLWSNRNGSSPSNTFVSEVAIYAAAHDTATQNSVALYEIIKWDIVE